VQDQLDQSRVLQQHIEHENLKTKHQVLILQEALANSQLKCQKLEDQFEDYSLASKFDTDALHLWCTQILTGIQVYEIIQWNCFERKYCRRHQSHHAAMRFVAFRSEETQATQFHYGSRAFSMS
jgi:hypothetical protein